MDYVITSVVLSALLLMVVAWVKTRRQRRAYSRRNVPLEVNYVRIECVSCGQALASGDTVVRDDNGHLSHLICGLAGKP